MGLFGDATSKARSTVEDAIKSLGADPAGCRVGDKAWIVRKGSSVTIVRLGGTGDGAFVQALSPVMKIPAGNSKFYETILSYNHEMGGLATFAATPQGELVLQTARIVKGMSAEEARWTLLQVAQFSDHYDDKLLDQFGRELAIHELQKV